VSAMPWQEEVFSFPFITPSHPAPSEDLILFNPLTSPITKELTIARLITNGIVSQWLGNIVSLESWSDAWIFKGLSKFLEFQIRPNDDDSVELFASEPTLRRHSFASEFPFTASEALSEEVARKGEKLQSFFLSFLLREASEEKLSMSFSSAFSCLHFSNDLLCNRGRSFRTNTASFDTGEVRREQAEAFNYIATMIYGSFRSSPAHSDPSSRMISTASCGRKRPKDCQLSIGVDLSKDLSGRNAI
jgi:Peptidase family M1 domain